VGKVYYMDPGIQFLVEVKSVSDLKDMCQLQVLASVVVSGPVYVSARIHLHIAIFRLGGEFQEQQARKYTQSRHFLFYFSSYSQNPKFDTLIEFAARIEG